MDKNTESTKKLRLPRSMPYLLGNEAAERFSFYGMKAILAIFLYEEFHYTHPQADAMVHLFIAMAYLMSIFGGLLADWFLGKYRTILWLSIVYCAGHACLAMFDTYETGFLTGLLLITIGAGGIKPCVSANIGDQLDKSNQSLVSKMFNWFYLSINIGSILSIAITPILRTKVGPKWAFGVPGILMGIATLVFWLGRKHYVKVKPKGFPKENFVFINCYMLMCLFVDRKGLSVRQMAEKKYSYKAVDGIFAVWRVLAVFAFIPIYWALYDQSGSEWIFQATNMNLHFLGLNWLPSQIQLVNPFLIITLIPLFIYYLYPTVEKVFKIEYTALRKIGTGFFFMIGTFVIIALIQVSIDAGGKPNVGWQVLAFVLLTISELLVSITGLEYAYTQAPKSMKSTIMAFFLLTVFVGDFFDTLVNVNIQNKGIFASMKGNASFYWFFLILMAAFTLLYLIVSRFIKEKSYIVEEDDDEENFEEATNDGVLEH